MEICLKTKFTEKTDMDIAAIIQDTLTQSEAGTIHFGQVINTLMTVGVESYFVDYRSKSATYYTSDGQVFSYVLAATHSEIAQTFSSEQLKAAILGAQAGTVLYPEFKQRSQAAGCVGYFVWIAGKHVNYLGRRGEMHIEPFPQ